MRILITNDDGINADGLKTLTRIANEVAGPDGEVWTVAPAFEQSGVGHCISYTHPFMIKELGPRRFAAEGSPADCVLAGLYHVLTDKRPDLILSGVNRGNNSAENALYSGTLGAAIEGALQGITSIALSQFYGPGNVQLNDPFEAAAEHGVDVVRKIIAHHPTQDADYRLFYNVNFPPCAAADMLGTRATTQGFRRDVFFGLKPVDAPTGRKFLWITGGPQHTPTLPGSDAHANLENYCSVVPMRADLTAHDALSDLGRAFE
jgi:5'-nucleotidase